MDDSEDDSPPRPGCLEYGCETISDALRARYDRYDQGRVAEAPRIRYDQESLRLLNKVLDFLRDRLGFLGYWRKKFKLSFSKDSSGVLNTRLIDTDGKTVG